MGVEMPSAMETVTDWISLNGCTANSLTDGTAFDFVTDVAGAETTPKVATCPTGVKVEFWSMAGVPHTPKFDSTFATRVFDWIVANPKVRA